MKIQSSLYIFTMTLLLIAFNNCAELDQAAINENSSINEEDNSGDSISPIIENPVSKSFCEDISIVINSSSGNSITVSAASNGRVFESGQLTTLRSVVQRANPGDTILLEEGTYTFAEAGSGDYTGLYITKDNITIKGNTDDPSKVILDSNYANHGGQTGLITIAGANAKIVDLTVQKSIFHLIHVVAGGNSVQVHNVNLVDGGQQFLKGSPGNSKLNGGSVTCSQFVMSNEGRKNVWGYGSGSTSCYTGGIDTHGANNWIVSDNTFDGIYCDNSSVRPAHGKKAIDRDNQNYTGGLAEFAIHMWDSDQGTKHTIERNKIINCARGIGLGLTSTSREYGGIVRNNMIFSKFAGGGEHDVGISIAGVKNTEVYNNTIFYSHSNAYPDAIEYRFDFTTGVQVFNNLTNKNIKQRNGASATVSNNVINASASYFVDANSGNLHLSSCNISGVTDSGAVNSHLNFDIDLDQRVSGVSDIGADQCN